MRRSPFLRFFVLTLLGTALVVGAYFFIANRTNLLTPGGREPDHDEHPAASAEFPPPPMSGFQSTVPSAPLDPEAENLPVPHPATPEHLPAPPDLEHPAVTAAAPLPDLPQVTPPDVLPIGLPFDDLKAADLHDSFDQARGGHKHEAIDILKPRGTPVHAVVEGNIAKLFTSKYGGLTIYQFDNAGAYCYYYAHLDHYAPGLKEGMLVRAGSVVGYVGSSGDANAATPHLHFTIFKLGPQKHWWEGTAINPYASLLHAMTAAAH